MQPATETWIHNTSSGHDCRVGCICFLLAPLDMTGNTTLQVGMGEDVAEMCERLILSVMDAATEKVSQLFH